MTAHKHFKQLVRSRMGKTGESYATARRQILLKPGGGATVTVVRRSEAQTPEERWHLPGNIPATTALRVVLTAAGVYDPRGGNSSGKAAGGDHSTPLSEAMVFGIAGGIGCGVCSFFYEKENFASFFVAGRHCWQDDLLYMKQVCDRLGVEPIVRETAGEKGADKHLRELLATGSPCIAWVDASHLPHRAMPEMWSGGGYHVITVYCIADTKGVAMIGDLTDEPIEIPLADLAKSRSRIKMSKNRLLAIPAGTHHASGGSAPKPAAGLHIDSTQLVALIRSGLELCHKGLTGKPIKGYPTMFNLESFRVWGTRIHGSKDKDAWERVFAHPRNFWRALTSLYSFTEHYGTGGGLCRPVFGDVLHEAAECVEAGRGVQKSKGAPAALDPAKLRSLAERYDEIGRGWTELAHAALPQNVPLMREARELLARKAELTAGGMPDDVSEIRAAWKKLDDLANRAAERFPLTPAECTELRASLQKRVLALYEAESAAHAALGDALR